MKNPIHKIAIYTATILFSAVPFLPDALDVSDEIKKRRTVEINRVGEAAFVSDKKYVHQNKNKYSL